MALNLGTRTESSPRSGTSGRTDVDHGSASQCAGNSKKGDVFPVLQHNQDVFSTSLNVGCCMVQYTVFICKHSAGMALGLLAVYIDLAGKKLDKTSELEARCPNISCSSLSYMALSFNTNLLNRTSYAGWEWKGQRSTLSCNGSCYSTLD